MQEILTYIIIGWAIFKFSKGFYNIILRKSKGCASGNCSHSCEGCALKSDFAKHQKVTTKKLF